jgi:hypothetical protein
MASEEYVSVYDGKGNMVPTGVEPDTFEFPDEKVVKQDKVDANPAAIKNEPEFDIEIVDDTPEKDRGRKPMASPPEPVTDDELESYDKKVQTRIKKLGKGYHDERRAKEEAQRMRDEAIRAAKVLADELQAVQNQLHEGSKIFIEQGKNGAEIELNAAKKAFKDAYDSGDGEALAEAQQRMAEATLKSDKVKNLRPIEVKETPVQIPEYSPEPQQDPKLSDWLSKNDWYGGETQEEDEMTGLAITVHNRLAREFGQKYIGSDEYYEKISSTIQKRFPDYFGSQEEIPTPVEEKPQRRAKPAANVVAPATRSTAPKKVQLTPTQVQIAKRLGVPLELYARKVAEQINGER